VLQRILDTAAEHSWQVTSVNLDSLTEAAFIKLLADLDYKKDFQIIIDCELERLNSILNLVRLSLTLTFRSNMTCRRVVPPLGPASLFHIDKNPFSFVVQFK